MSNHFQLSFADQAFSNRKKVSRNTLTLLEIDMFVDWKSLEERLKVIDKTKTGKGGRPPLPLIWKLKMLFIQFLYNLSEPELEDQMIDRLSFQKFVGLNFGNEIPDFTTLWRFKEAMIAHNLNEVVFESILKQLDRQGLIVKKGTIVDATIIESTKKPTEQPEETQKTEEKLTSQKDHDATFTAKRDKYYYGYKGHIGVDKGSKLIRKRAYSPANVHDIRKLEECLSGDEQEIYADSAYQKKEYRAALEALGIHDGIMTKGKDRSEQARKDATVRSGVEHVFGYMKCKLKYNKAVANTLLRNQLRFDMSCVLYNVLRGIRLIREQAAY